MKRIMGLIRKADQDFHMIGDGDRIAVGVSGGKDSLLLLYALALYRRFGLRDFALRAVTVKMGLEPFDLTKVEQMCREIDVPFTAVETEIGRIVFEERKEKNPCALCAKMRRGALNEAAVKLGCNKVALGHHREDALETLLLSLLHESRIHTFAPVTHLEKTGLAVIRPLLYAPEKTVARFARELGLPVVASPCPANGNTERAEMKALLDGLCKRYPDARKRMLAALQNTEQYGLWDRGGEDA